MTTLQRQLAGIAATSSHELDLKAQKKTHSKSLLFESSVASSQDFDTIYQICFEGFEELCRLDERFAIFANSLFSKQSKSEKRTSRNKEENEQLDSVIESFLGLVGARLLLRPAVKAVEWLIRRFRIDEHNTESLLLTFLPYHATPLFLTLLSILPRRLPLTFRFLHPYIASLNNPPRQVIVYATANTKSLFSAFNQYILNTVKEWHHYPLLLSFWVSVNVQAIGGMLEATLSGREGIQRQRMEDLLLLVLPVLNDALTVTGVRELTMGSCAIITILGSKSHLEDDVVNALMKAIVPSCTSEALGPCLTSLAVLARRRSNVRLPRAVSEALLKLDGVQELLASLSRTYPVGRLALGLILAATDMVLLGKRTDKGRKLHELLQIELLNETQLVFYVKYLLAFLDQHDTGSKLEDGASNDLAAIFQGVVESPTANLVLKDILHSQRVATETLEMKLGTSLPALISTESAMDLTDGNVLETDSLLPPSTDYEHLELPLKLPENTSFLAGSDSNLFDDVAKNFLQAVSSRSDSEHYASIFPADEGSQESLSTISFLIRFLSMPFPSKARGAALTIASERLCRLATERGDVQATLPYIISALADRFANVRRAAADFVVKLNAIHEHDTREGKSSSKEQRWGYGSLYSTATESLHWLSTKDFHRTLSALLVPAAEECILDEEHVGRVIHQALRKTSGARDVKEHAKGADLKSSLRSSICTFLGSHISKTPVLAVRSRILPMLTNLGKSGSPTRLHILLPLVRDWASLPCEKASNLCQPEKLHLTELDQLHVAVISPREQEGLECLKSFLNGEHGSGRSGIQEAAFRHLQSIWHSCGQPAQLSIAEFLLRVAVTTPRTEDEALRQRNALDTIRGMQLPTDVLVSYVEALPSAHQTRDLPPPSKKRRVSPTDDSTAPAPAAADTSHSLSKYSIVLGLIDSSNPEQHPQLLRGLFHSLGELHHFRTMVNSDLAYLQELVLRSLLAIVDNIKQSPAVAVDHAGIRVDLLVDCVRSTPNPHVQNAAVLVISSLAACVPELVLHSVMPIFTFMSNTILRQNDDYSAHVIDQILAQVVPPLAASLRQQKTDFVIGASEALLSFTAAFEHIPLHRRLRLFVNLATSMGPDDSVFAMIAMLVDRYPSDRQVQQFMTQLLNEFDTQIGLKAAKRYVDLITDALQTRGAVFESVLHLKEKGAEHKERTFRSLLDALCMLLGDESFRRRIARDLRVNQVRAAPLRAIYAQLLERSVELSRSIQNHPELQQAAVTAFRTVLELLPLPDFLESIDTLLDRPDEELRRMIFKSIDAHLQGPLRTDVRSREAILALLPRLSGKLEQSTDPTSSRTLLSCIDHLSERYGRQDKSLVAQAGRAVAGTSALGSNDERLRIMSLLCLASFVEILREEIIPLIPQILHQSHDYLRVSMEPQTPNAQLHNAVYTFMLAVIDHIPFVFSDADLEITLQLSHVSAHAGLGPEADDTRKESLVLLAQKIEPRVCFTAIERSLMGALRKGYHAMLEHIQTLQNALVGCSKSVVARNSNLLFGIFLTAFDLRRLRKGDDLLETYTSVQVDEIEGILNSTIIDMIMKMSDATFRPFFIRLVQWTSKGLPKTDIKGIVHRTNAVFTFFLKFSESLKSIVTGYADHVLELFTTALERPPSKDIDNELLRKNSLLALCSSFEHDQDGFWQAPNHFDVIVGPLINQLTHVTTQVMQSDVLLSIVGLAVAASSADHHKEMNTKILKLLRSDDARIRLAAIQCEQKLTDRLGDDWLSLLPEMLPFIGELQEDTDEDVERETLRWVSRIEEILGEKLDSMLQ